MTKLRYTFLCYAPRSGSTLAADRISRHFNVVVLPETTIGYLILSRHPSAIITAPRIRSLIRDDKKIGWVSEEGLARIPEAGLTPREVLDFLVSEYSASKDILTEEVLVKAGAIYRIWPQVLSHIPDAKMLFVVRDGRAVVNSLLRTQSAYLGAGVSMGLNDVVHSAKLWSIAISTQQHILQNYGNDFIRRLDYTELLEDLESSIASIGDWAGWSPNPSDSTTFFVHKNEQSIHKLVSRPPQSSREEAWRTELSVSERIVVEHISERQLIDLGITDLLDTSSPTLYRVMAINSARHYLIQFRIRARRLMAIESFDDFIDRFRYSLLRRGVR